MAAVFNSMPMVTFAQNNGVIQLTGVASRYVAFFIAGLLVLLGLFPMIGAVLQLMPKPVLGGAELVMFGTVAVAGIKILAEAGLHRRNMLIVAISLGMGLGIAAVPQALRNIFESPITVGALCAIVLNIFLPEEFIELEEDDFDPEASILQVMENPEIPAKAEPATPAAVAQLNR
jgi:xanthine permease XanP